MVVNLENVTYFYVFKSYNVLSNERKPYSLFLTIIRLFKFSPTTHTIDQESFLWQHI
jgi:hypothetical protein